MFLSECCTFCTILHITFLSLERYLAVCWPITAKTLVTRGRTRAVIGCLWLGAAVSAAPVLVMVGVEDVGGEELGLSGWRDDGRWAVDEGEERGLHIGGEGHRAFIDGEFDGSRWEGNETKKWRQSGGERSEEGDERRTPAAPGEGDVDGEQQNQTAEDDAGGWEEGVDGTQADNRECRCTDYAVSSGLLSAMMVLSNLYFLVPLCILGVVYGLIGRALWLRPQSSRRDQSHRNTVKMMGKKHTYVGVFFT